jgi:ankyrin repeat protein
MPYIKNNEPIRHVLDKHNNLKNKQLKSPQSDSIILLLLKISYDMLAKSSVLSDSPYYSESIKEIKYISHNQLSRLREVILEWPKIVDLSDFKQQTPLMLAVHNKDYDTAEALLKSGANPNLQDIKGRTALHSACASRTLECVELLIKYKIDECITSFEGATALHTAVRMGEIKIAELLMNNFPHLLDEKEFNYRTPLMLAEELANNVDYYNFLSKQLQDEQRQVVSHDNYKKLFTHLLSDSQVNGHDLS